MLKSLELFGFKSFADRTRFDFAEGITCVVGPNGSGKSNVVDAVKWILGDQSAKSLRGKEMTDVIFNGASGRKPNAFAEATLTFDNSNGDLPLDAREVQVGRRIWRNGDAEYLINQNTARLKDIKELFMGTGASTGAYSIIEQGRVDQILQANASARRMVFEEAAGISRYKARKAEATRKLERVDQNLARLTDIVDEVEAQLTSMRNQAQKAAKYRELAEELKTHWFGLAADDCRHLSRRIASLDEEAARTTAEIEALNARQSELEEQVAGLDGELAEVDDRLRNVERRSAAVREQIASSETTLDHQRQRGEELGAEITRLRRQQTMLRGRLDEMACAHAAAREGYDDFCREYDEKKSALSAQGAAVEEMESHVESLRATLEEHRRRHRELERDESVLNDRLEGTASRLEVCQIEERRLEETLHQLDAQIAESRNENDRRRSRVEGAQKRVGECQQRTRDLADEIESLRGADDASRQELAELREQRSGFEARRLVLEDLEQRQEGVRIGVKEILNRAQTSDYPPWNDVVGTVADLIDVDLEDAALLEVALGERAQLIVLRKIEGLIEYLQSGVSSFSGRVGFVAVPGPEGAVKEGLPEEVFAGGDGDCSVVSDSDEVADRADRLLRFCENLPGLAELLLGDTWIVETLGVARRLAARKGGGRFVTRQGELLEADGSLFVGSVAGEVAIVSRKSELRRLKNEILKLTRRISDHERRRSALAEDFTGVEAEQAEARRQLQHALDELAELKGLAAEGAATLDRLQKERGQLDEERVRNRKSQEELHAEATSARGRIEEARAERERLDSEIVRLEESLAAEVERIQELKQELTDQQLVFAKDEERLTNMQNEIRRTEIELGQRREQSAEAERRLDSSALKRGELRLKSLNTSARLSELYLELERLCAEVDAVVAEKRRVRGRKSEIAEQEAAVRAERREFQDRQHGYEIQIRDLRHQLDSLGERIREEYQVSLEEVVASGASALREYLIERGQANSPDEADGGDDGAEQGESAESLQDVKELHESAAERQNAGMPDDSPADVASEAVAFDAELFQEIRGELEQRVKRLRRKLKLMGSVNTDSLRDLDELESRFGHLNGQLQDLVEAKTTLEEIIRKINAESKRLFTESFETIRANFQDLFRKLFGGGEGDIILEDPEYVLDCAIDIVARPPGKELRSISLLSGGEKTMTAVALLLAIFRSRPSPFCVLDEVDAALDEANIDRYSSVLREFQKTTQFIVITHSKRSMTVADILYGVTMEQSGVSKRMAVRFEDVSENGEFRYSPDGSQAA